MSIQLQPSVPLVKLVKTEPPTVIKNEPPEEALEKEISPYITDIDVVYHSLSEDLIKNEIVPENILETKYFESVETQVLVKTEDSSDENVTRGTDQEVIEVQDILENRHLESVQTQALVIKTDNSPFIKTENINQRNKSEDTSEENINRGTGQGMVEVQVSKEHSYALSNLDTDEQSVLNFFKNLNGAKSRKSKSPKKTDFAEYYKTGDSTLWEKEKAKIKVIKAPVIPVEAHEYTSLAKDKHVCNHCQRAFNTSSSLRRHIKQMHRKLTTMYQCPYCTYKWKWKDYIIKHIIIKHKNTKDIQWFQCNLCEMKFKLKQHLTRHNMKVHLKHKQMKDGLDLREKRYHCNNCDYKTDHYQVLKRHNLVHLKPEEAEYFYCYHCSHKSNQKSNLKNHIFRHHLKNVKQEKRHHCDKCNYKSYTSNSLKIHKLTHLKPEEIQYFYCYHCSFKSKLKGNLKQHIFTHHFKNVKQGKRHHCDKCDYKTYTSAQMNNHKLSHLKPEEVQYFYCYHCSYKTKRKSDLRRHIFRHFKKEQVEFDCYICNFMTPKRESFIKHIKKHSKIQNKYF